MKLKTKKQLNNNGSQGDSFHTVIQEATHEMPTYKRRFSTFIHSRIVWSVSEWVSKTIARPNALLFGAIFSFTATICVYLLSKNLGYSLSGFESIGAFIVGWIAGIIFDIVSALLRKRD